MATRVACAALLAFQATGASAFLYQPQSPPVSVDLVVSPQTPLLGTEDQDPSTPGLSKTAEANGVDQLKLSLGGEGEMYVTWQTGIAALTLAANGAPTAPDTASYPATVSYGLHPDPTGKYENSVTNCEKTSYVQNYSGGITTAGTFQNPTTFYQSQIIVHCLLKNLQPATKYYYRAGASGGYSVEYSFTTPPPKGSNFPVRMGVIADVGNTQNSTSTLQHLTANTPDFYTIIGDLVYADRYTSLGVANIKNGVTLATVPNAQTFQPYWDEFGRQLQTFGNSAQVPVQVLAGNHEIERDDTGVPFKAITARYKTSFAQAGSSNPLYYSFNYGGVHTIMLHAYDGPIPNSPAAPGFANGGNYPQTSFTAAQIAWLQADLAAVDRTVTPWVVAQMHPPYYNTYVSHYKEVECLQQQIEDIIYNAGVDFFLFGHIHAYERMNRVYKYQNDPCAPVHVTLGDGGNIEYGVRQFADRCYTGVTPVPVTCLNADNLTARLANPVAPVGAKYCNTYENPAGQPAGRGPNTTVAGAPVGYFLPSVQPPYSAYRNPSFGHAILEFKSATEATISWYANQFTNAVATDVSTITRDPSCPNQKGGFTNKPPALPSSVGAAAKVINSIVDGSLVNNVVNHAG